MTIIQEALLLVTLWALATINLLIIGHIIGSQVGMLLAKAVNCIIGFDVHFKNHETGVSFTENFKGLDAWTAQNDFEMIRRYARRKELTDIEGDL